MSNHILKFTNSAQVRGDSIIVKNDTITLQKAGIYHISSNINGVVINKIKKLNVGEIVKMKIPWVLNPQPLDPIRKILLQETQW